MSGGGWKEPFLKVAQLDSQNLKHLGQKWNIGFLEDEAAHNEKNPGRAITKAAEYALAGYLGGLYGGPEGAGGAAGEGAIGAGTGAAASGAVDMAAEQAAVQAAEQAAAQGATSSVMNPTIWEKLASGSGSTGSGKQLAMQMGMQSLKPQEPQPMGAPPPRQQAGNAEPLPLPYSQRGTNGLLSLEEIERKRKMGLLR
jgi:hypothetical protein